MKEMILKMNSPVLIIALLIFGALDAHCRAIDDQADNSIEENKSRNRNPFEQGFRKTKMPPPVLTQTLQAPLEIVCEIAGTPAPTIEWIAGPHVEDSYESNSLSDSSPTAIVNVRSVYVLDHILTAPKVFTCVGQSGAKTVFGSTTVYPPSESKELIHYGNKLLAQPRKPVITLNHITHIDIMGSDVILPCKAFGKPHPKISWLNKDRPITEQDHRYKVLETGELLITDLKWEDMGTFVCVARNSMGKAMAETFLYPLLGE